MRKEKGERRKKEKKVKNLSKKEGKWMKNLINELLSESVYKIDEKIIGGYRIIKKIKSKNDGIKKWNMIEWKDAKW